MVSIAQNASIGWTYYTTGPVATRDFYTFTVSPGFGNVQITMNDRGVGSYNPDFEISRNGSVLRNTNFVYGNSQTLYFNDLQAGDYTIAVYLQPSSAPPTLRDWQLGSYRYQWRYDVDVYASRSYSPVDNAGNTPSAARAITVGSSSTSYTDWVGSTDTNDYYRFSLANSGNFNLNLTGMTADADVQLLNSSGSLIASSTNDGTASESITGQLSAGTYYIRVYPYSGDTNYNLSVSAVSLAPVDNAGNTPSAARAITVGSSSTSYTDWVGSTDTNDYYRFSLANSGNFNLNLTGMTADADVQLLNSSGSLIASSTNDGTASESITGQLSAGTYYIRVYPYSGDTNYNLSVSAVSLAPVNNLSLIGDNTNNVLTGGLGNDTLEGLGGNDTLNGGAGNDTLTGGTESDYFTFNTPTEGIDRITDFSVIDDTIVVSATGFSGGLVAGAAIIPNQLVIGSGATTLNHRFIYNSSTGALFFDADGNGALASTQIATLNPNLALTHQDIYVA